MFIAFSPRFLVKSDSVPESSDDLRSYSSRMYVLSSVESIILKAPGSIRYAIAAAMTIFPELPNDLMRSSPSDILCCISCSRYVAPNSFEDTPFSIAISFSFVIFLRFSADFSGIFGRRSPVTGSTLPR